MKQTAVEWLVEQLELEYNSFPLLNAEACIEAKEMEKQQIMKAVYDSMGTNFDANMGRAEEYYNETYNKSINNKG